MRRTSVPLLLALALAGGVVVWLLQIALVSGGQATLVPPGTLAGAVAVAASGLVVEQWCRLPPQDPEDDEQQEARRP